MTSTENLFAAVLDSLDSQIAVLDRDGTIDYVNDAWRRFAIENGMPVEHCWEGINYMTVCNAAAACGDREGGQAFVGIQAVLSGELPTFTFEYPCHSPFEKRWFLMRATPLKNLPDHFVVAHYVITERKLAEERVEVVNRELARLAATDKLTLLANRAKLDEILINEIYRAGRYETGFATILLDVDHFKLVNDRFGHPVGDAVLTCVADILRNRMRESDVAGRWGGEEFLIVLPGCDEVAACSVAEQLRQTIANTEFHGVGVQTCSFGVAEHAPGESADSLMTRVDAALYRAKNKGRNRVEAAGD